MYIKTATEQGNDSWCTPEMAINHRGVRKNEDIPYKPLAETEAESIEDVGEEMGRYGPRSSRISAILRFIRSKLKLKYLPLLLLPIAILLICIRLIPPWPIVWSDTMHKIIYRKSADRLTDRLVHLDLKGAAPRGEYLQKLLPLFKEWGATGLLIEWEDTFPYHGSFENIRHGDAYDDKTVKAILKTARDAGLKVIPLVQTFGHMEWVLKHKEYTSVREVTRYPQVICPSNNQSLEVVKKLIDDIATSHKGYIDAIHIGADEAYHVGKECKRCQKRIEELGSLDRLMLEYVSQVAAYAKKQHNLRVLMWHDMFEKTERNLLRSYHMHELVEPVIWGYQEYLLAHGYFSDGAFKRFGQVFDRMWIASAFKGANWPDQSFVDLPRYAQNHLGWLQVLSYYDSSLSAVGGIILTGWQRFDHFAILCELLPPAIPSLVFNLQIIKYGGMKPELFENTRKALKCEMPATNWTEDAPEWGAIVERFFNETVPKAKQPAIKTLRCDFPGSEIYALIERLRLVKYGYDTFMNMSIRRGWIHDYNLYQQYGSIHHAEVSYNITDALLHHYTLLAHQFQIELPKVFYEDTVSEWLYENIQVPVDRLKKISLGLVQIKQTVEFRNRPLAHLKLEL